jgi:hypothetical protein
MNDTILFLLHKKKSFLLQSFFLVFVFWEEKFFFSVRLTCFAPRDKPTVRSPVVPAPFPDLTLRPHRSGSVSRRQKRSLGTPAREKGKLGNFGSLNSDEMPRIPMIKFPKRNLKPASLSPSTPGAPSSPTTPILFSSLGGLPVYFVIGSSSKSDLSLFFPFIPVSRQRRRPQISTRP